LRLQEIDQPAGLANLSLWNWIVAPFGPASSFEIPARLHIALIRTTSISVFTSFGSGPKRSISSAAKALQLDLGRQAGQPAVQPQPQVKVGDIVSGIITGTPRFICGAQVIVDVVSPCNSPDLILAIVSSSICW
jgi:hypothetical protein